jgi:hypothetical protein
MLTEVPHKLVGTEERIASVASGSCRPQEP